MNSKYSIKMKDILSVYSKILKKIVFFQYLLAKLAKSINSAIQTSDKIRHCFFSICVLNTVINIPTQHVQEPKHFFFSKVVKKYIGFREEKA